MTLLLVLLGGAVGASARYLTDVTVQRRHGTDVPWGTWTVNVLGAFVLGVVAESGPHWVLTLVGTGFCGALTTFSTFRVRDRPPARAGPVGIALTNVAGSLGAGLLAAVLGWWLGTVL